MPERATVHNAVQVGVEVTPGTVVPASRRLQSTRIEPNPIAPVNAVRAEGSKFNTDVILTKEHTEAALSGEMSFTDLCYLFSGLLTTPTITIPTSNGIYTVSLGSPFGGTFTLTYNGATTGAIAHNATAATVEAALTGLSTLDAGDVTVAKPSNGVYTVTFSGEKAGLQLPLTGNGGSLSGGTFTITTTACSLTRRWRFLPNTYAPDTPKTFTFEVGSSGGAERYAYGLVNGLTFRVTKEEASVNGDMLGQKLAEGITMTAGGGTANEIQQLNLQGNNFNFYIGYGIEDLFGANYMTLPSELQAGLEAIPQIGAGNVLVTGNPGGPYTIEFVGSLAGTNQPELEISGTTGSPIPIVTTLQVGGTAAPITNIPSMPVDPKRVSVFVGSSLTSINRLLRCLEAELAFTERFGSVFTVNEVDESYSGHVEQAVDFGGQLVLAHDATSRGFMTDLRDKTKKYCRWVATGPVIEGAVRHRIQITMAFKFAQEGRGDQDGVWSNTFGMIPVHDDALGSAVEVVIDTTLTQL